MNTLYLFTLAKSTVEEANELLIEIESRNKEVVSANGKDIKLEADMLLDNKITKSLLANSEYPVLSEELGYQENSIQKKDYMWIVDPLDGSMNFLRGIKGYAVSIALWKDDTPIFGVVYDFSTGDLYEGIVGEFAKLNGKDIAPSEVSKTTDGILATGFPVKDIMDEENLKSKIELYQKFKKIRMFGTATLSLAFVASGKVEAYYESGIRLWDVAGSLAILKAAGGNYKILTLDDEYTLEVYADNGRINA